MTPAVIVLGCMLALSIAIIVSMGRTIERLERLLCDVAEELTWKGQTSAVTREKLLFTARKIGQ